MNFGHNGPPEYFCQIFLGRTGQFGVVVITCPGGGGIIRRIACEPDIVIIRRGSCFACDSHIAKVDRAACTGSDNVFHGISQQKGGGFFDYPVAFRFGVVQDDFSVVVNHFGIEGWFIVGSAVCYGGISGVQFFVGHAHGDAAQCERLLDV